jgi:PhzF family phenazine biosynthesis protein
MHSSLVPCWREQHNTWLRFERLTTRTVPVPDWVAEIFSAQAQPAAAALCADEEGYLILQWPDETLLKQLTPSLTTLAARSKRALICTAAHPSAGADAVQLRYFAPQYGVDEDPATGSAMRVLADYWSDRFHTLTAQQCSREGGLLLARVAKTHVEVGGRCRLVQLTTQNV